MLELLNPRVNMRRYSWEELFVVLKEYEPQLYHHIVKSELPLRGTQKCKTDGASKSNQGISYYGFYIRDHNGDL